MSQHVIALDQGTTSSRTIIFDVNGKVVSLSQHPFAQIYPQPGWVEHDPMTILYTQLESLSEAFRTSGLSAADIAAVGITNQRETTIVWEKETGRPVYNAIVWQCRRTAPLCEELRADGWEEKIREKTGLLIDAYFSGTKLRWILDNVPGARERAERGELLFGTVETWLIWRLTGGAAHVTDYSNASRTMLFNIHTLTWDEELCRLLGIPMCLLPRPVSNSEIYGTVVPGIEGLEALAGIPVCGAAGDQQSALFGQGCHERGQAKNTYGTGGFLLMNVGGEPRPSENRLITTAAWKLGCAPTQYALEGSVFIAGAVVQWLRDQMDFIESASEIEALAREVPDSGGVWFVPAFVGLGAPYWDPDARGMLIGLTRGTNRAHIARAALEAIAFQSAEVLTAMAKDATRPVRELRVDGGAARNDLLMQMQADIAGVPVIRPAQTETTALGAAFLAGLASGFWQSTDEIASLWRAERVFEPVMNEDQRGFLMNQWARAVGRARKWNQ